jgi:SAM-dependent methyltransferase
MENQTFKYTGSELLVMNERALSNYNRWIVSQFIKVGTLNGAKRVLDFGAGIGSLATIFNEETSIRPATVEVDAMQRETLRARGYAPYPSLDAVSERFDLIYTSNVLEHIEDDVEALVGLRGLLAEDGRIAIFVPAFRMIWTSMDDKVGHHRRYTKKMLRKHLEDAGFEVQKLCYRDSIGFLVALLFKATGDKSGEPSFRSLWIFDRFLLPISRILDLVASPLFGKNVLAVARPSENGSR